MKRRVVSCDETTLKTFLGFISEKKGKIDLIRIQLPCA